MDCERENLSDMYVPAEIYGEQKNGHQFLVEPFYPAEKVDPVGRGKASGGHRGPRNLGPI